jgi:sucrose phosphorylase
MLGLKGIPGVYFHSLTATPNDKEGAKATGRARSLNRKKWNIDELENLLAGQNSTAKVFTEYRRRLQIRRKHPAFHPDSAQRVLNLGPDLFVFVRTAPERETIACISSFSKERKELHLDQRVPELNSAAPCTDLLGGARYSGTGKVLTLDPFQTVWLTS